MREGMPSYKQHLGVLPFLLVSVQLLSPCEAAPSPSSPRLPRANPPPEKASFNALDTTYLPAQIGGIVGSYALSLVLVALLLLCLHKKRRDIINAPEITEEEKYAAFAQEQQLQTEEEYRLALEQQQQNPGFSQPPLSPFRNYSLPSGLPLSPTRSQPFPLSPTKSHASIGGWTIPSPTSTVLASGADYSVDQTVVKQDRAMAQSQLEDMYKYVMEQEEAKQQGRVYEPPPSLASPRNNSSMPGSPAAPPSALRKSKPAGLDLNKTADKSESRGNSFLSFLRSPRKDKRQREISISSPIITPMSGTFPGHLQQQEMSSMPRRDYGKLQPPPVPSDLPFRASAAAANTLPTPEMSPVSAGGMSIDERIDAAIGRPPTRDSRKSHRTARGEDKDHHSREVSDATSGANSDAEPVSAVSEKSTTGLVGLPTSPKPGVNRFPSLDSLPASPRGSAFPASPLGQAFPRPNKPSAIRTGGALPLRAYEPAIVSPTGTSHSHGTQMTKQTVFTRADNPLSPGLPTGMRTPWTGAPVPYTPYQPFSPVIPMTPSLMNKADRKRMKSMVPKTPTVEMVREAEDLW
ncbi:hypothetical protein QBC39DRAFT_97506 [Podospora conica]|nr:hypothetical protein QBC39DRAFT_97506 [Schizothecium conicum]